MDGETSLTQVALEIAAVVITRQPDFPTIVRVNLWIAPNDTPLRGVRASGPRAPKRSGIGAGNDHWSRATLTVPGRRGADRALFVVTEVARTTAT